MRKIRPFVAIALLIVVALLTACKPNPKETLSRKWKPVDASGEGITEDVKKNIVKEGNIMEFTATGDFTSYSPGEKPEIGSYTMSADGKMLNVISGGGREVQMIIRELSIHKMVIENHGLTLVMEPTK